MFCRHGRFLCGRTEDRDNVPGPSTAGVDGECTPVADASRDRVRRGIVKRAAGVALAAACSSSAARAAPVIRSVTIPSYYPDEIRIDAVDPAAAGKGLVDETLHAYVGAVPNFAGPVPGHVKSVKSLGSFLVLSFNPASARFASADDRCAAARGILAALARGKSSRLRFPSRIP